MAQEFTIKSADIESKINQLLPSQGGFQPGVDISASTMVVPVVDLTETAEGSNVRMDLQKALSFTNVTQYNIEDAGGVVWDTPGYILMKGFARIQDNDTITIRLFDGTSRKIIVVMDGVGTGANGGPLMYEYIFFLRAGDSIEVISDSNQVMTSGVIRQLADINGNLVNPA